jgi:competence protein ComEC
MARNATDPKPISKRHPGFNRRHKNGQPKLYGLATILLTITLLFGVVPGKTTRWLQTRFNPPSAGLATATAAGPALTGQLEVHFLDVGQADCILVIQGDDTMLIDAGNIDDAEHIVSYLKKQEVEHLDYLVATHPHGDHIGSVDDVAENFAIDEVLMPDLVSKYKTYKDAMQVIHEQGLPVIHPNFSQTYQLGQASFQILSQPALSYDTWNSASLILMITFGQTKFLMTGDTEVRSEEQLLATNFNIRADVLKVAHHGSDSSTSVDFLDVVQPSAAVIEVGQGNPYGYPVADVLNDLDQAGIAIYRTDLAGDIVAISDGTTVTFDTQPDKGLPGQIPA